MCKSMTRESFVGSSTILLQTGSSISVCLYAMGYLFEGIQDIFINDKNSLIRPLYGGNTSKFAAQSFTFFVNGTDGTDNNDVVFARFGHVSTEFTKLGIKVLSFGADGAECISESR